MKRYRFDLENVLRVRKSEEDAARQSLALANAQLRAAMQRLSDETARYAAIGFNTGSMEIEDLRRERQSAELIDLSVLAARKQVEIAATYAGSCHMEWAEASRRVAALERLDSRRHVEYRVEEAAYERAEIDDIVTSRFVPGTNELSEPERDDSNDGRGDRDEVLTQ